MVGYAFLTLIRSLCHTKVRLVKKGFAPIAVLFAAVVGLAVISSVKIMAQNIDNRPITNDIYGGICKINPNFWRCRPSPSPIPRPSPTSFPTTLSAKPAATSVVLSWDPRPVPANANFTLALWKDKCKELVEYNQKDLVGTAGITISTNHTFNRLQPQTAYCARIFKAFTDPVSNEAVFTTLPPPSPIPIPSPTVSLPTAPTVTYAGISYCSGLVPQLVVNWQDKSNNETGFKVEAREQSENNWTDYSNKIEMDPAGGAIVFAVQLGKTYSVRVGAYNDAGVNWTYRDNIVANCP